MTTSCSEVFLLGLLITATKSWLEQEALTTRQADLASVPRHNDAAGPDEASPAGEKQGCWCPPETISLVP